MKKRVCALLLVWSLLVCLCGQTLAYDLPVVSKPLDFSNASFLDQEGEGWRWDGMSQTLILSDGLRVSTSGSAVVLPAGATLQIRGAVEIVSSGDHGIVLGSGANLAIASGASLTIQAAGDGIQAGSLSLESGTLDITAGGSCLHATAGDISLGAGASVSLSGSGRSITADHGKVVLSGTAQLEASGGGIYTGTGGGDRVTVESGADVTIRCGSTGAVGIETGGNVRLSGTLNLTSGGAGLLSQGTVVGENAAVTIQASGGDGLSAADEITLTGGSLAIELAGGNGLTAGKSVVLSEATLTLGEVAGDGITAPEGFSADQSTVTLTRAGGSALISGKGVTLTGGSVTLSAAGGDGLSTPEDIILTGAALTVGEVEGYGVRTSEGTLTIDPDSTLSVTSAGEDGVSVYGLVTMDGTLTVSQAAGQGLVSTTAGIRMSGTAQVNAQGDGVRAQLGITTSETSLLNVEAGGIGVLSQTGSVTLLSREGEEASITAGGDGVVSADKVIISQPGEWSIDAGTVGIRAQGDVTVGGAEEGVCNLSITSSAESIWSENGNVLMGPCEDLYFFDGTVHVNSSIGKTLSVLEGAGLLYGSRNGFAIGIIRKDYTITADMTPELLQLRTLQIGAEHTVTVAAGAQVKVGPLILGKNAWLNVQNGSNVYYNGPTTQVTGSVASYATAGMDLTAGSGSLPDGASWDSSSKTLSLDGTVVDLSAGPVLKLPAGSTIQLSGSTTRLSAGSQGSVVECEGDLTITGGTLEVSGGTVGIDAAGSLTLVDATVSVKGASEAALSGASVTCTNSDVDIYGTGAAFRATQGTISVDSLPEDEYHIGTQGGFSILVGPDGNPATVMDIPAGGAAPSTVTTEEQVNPDGTTTVVETDTVTGVVNESTTAADGTITVSQTRPDGVSSTITAAPDGTTTATVTLPEGVEQAVVALKVPDATATTVAELVAEDGTTTILPLSDLVDGTLQVYLEDSAQLTFSDQSTDFIDVSDDAWYAGPVDFVSSRGLFLGVGENQFDPLGTTTCGMMATVLHRLAGAPEVQLPEEGPPFGAIPEDAYYAQGVAWALANGVVDGVSDGFAPETAITREQLAAMLYQTAGVLGMSQEEKAPLSSFTDADQASQFAQTGLRWAVAQGILQGRGDGTLDPTGTATRAEVSAMIQRFVGLILQGQ